MEFLEAIDIEKKYGNYTALKDVSIAIPEGKIFGLLGPNGAGKTSLIRIINMITAPDKGRLLLKGEPLSSKHLINIGYMPEERGLYKKMKIGEQALYLAQLKGLSRIDALKQLKYWFDKFEIQSWWEKKVEELSKGMQQKIQFIVTVLHNPALLIFDEPFSGFDPINANILKQEILELKKAGTTIIFSTHNMSSVEEICDHIALINKSKKILDGPINQIKEQYKANIFEVIFRNKFDKFNASLSADYEITELTTSEASTKIQCKLKNGATPNDLMSKLITCGNIVSFNEIIPTMNEIFIEAVENENKKQQ